MMKIKKNLSFLALILLFSGCSDIPQQSLLFDENPTSLMVNNTSETIVKSPAQTLEVYLRNGKTIKFRVELALTELQRQQGLMFRQELAEDAGMLFDFQKPAKLSFWMKNTLIPLDMIFADEQGEILYIKPNAPPCRMDPCESYVSERPARYVLEVKGGLSEKLGIREGDRFLLMNDFLYLP